MMLITKTEIKKILTELSVSVEKRDDRLITARAFFGIGTVSTCDAKHSTTISIDNQLIFDVLFSDLKKFVGAVTGDTLTFSIIDDRVRVASDKGEIILLDQFQVDRESLELVDDIDNTIRRYDHPIEISAAVYNAIDTNNPKFELNGLFLNFKNGEIAATDTRRLHVDSIEMQDLEGIIIPKVALKKDSTITNLRWDDKTAHYTLDGMQKQTRLINGKYPDYDRIIPERTRLSVKMNGNDLLKLKKYGDAKMSFKNNKVVVTEINDKNNGQRITLNCDYPCDTKFEIGINMRYVCDSISDNEISLNFNANSLPYTLTHNDRNNKSIAVIMPFALDDSSIDAPNIPDSASTFKYSAQTKKVKRITPAQIISDKNNIILEQKRVIKELTRRLKIFEDDNKVVKNSIFQDILAKCR